MAIAATFKKYLETEGIDYDTVTHPHSNSARESAYGAHVPMTKLAKAVVFRDENQHYLMAVVPSQCRAEVSRLNTITNHNLELAEEKELADLFRDCEMGAIPPAGLAYSMPVIWDDLLQQEEDVYLEAGDHEHLLHMSRDDFSRLMGHSSHGRFSEPVSQPL